MSTLWQAQQHQCTQWRGIPCFRSPALSFDSGCSVSPTVAQVAQAHHASQQLMNNWHNLQVQVNLGSILAARRKTACPSSCAVFLHMCGCLVRCLLRARHTAHVCNSAKKNGLVQWKKNQSPSNENKHKRGSSQKGPKTYSATTSPGMETKGFNLQQTLHFVHFPFFLALQCR